MTIKTQFAEVYAPHPLISAPSLEQLQANSNGYKNPAVPELDQQRPYRVIRNPKADNPLLDNEIRSKLEAALTSKGFSFTEQENTKYLVTYEYSIAMASISLATAFYSCSADSLLLNPSPALLVKAPRFRSPCLPLAYPHNLRA